MNAMERIKYKNADKQPTLAEWPIKIWDASEIPPAFREGVMKEIGDDFSQYSMVYATERRTDPSTFKYLFAYGNDKVIYMRKELDGIFKKVISRTRIARIAVKRELLNAELLLSYQDAGGKYTLRFPYVPSTYYLYDPFINWILGLEKDFSPEAAERKNPRPEKLYRESLSMYNYSLAAYRLGTGFKDYHYTIDRHRKKLMPWKIQIEEWLDISMERGNFHLHSCDYLTEYIYSNLRKSEE